MSHQKIPPNSEGDNGGQKFSNVRLCGRNMPLPIVPIGGKQSQCDRGKVLLEIEDSDGRGQAKLLHHYPRADAIRWIEKNSTDERLNYEHDSDRVRVGGHIDGAESREERPWYGARWPPHTEYLVSDCPDQ